MEDPSARGQLYPRRAAPIPCPPPPTLPDRGDGHTGHGAAACTYAQHPRPSGTCAAASGSGRVCAGGWSSAQGRARGRPGRCCRPGILSHIWTRDPTCHFALGPARYAAGLVTDPPPRQPVPCTPAATRATGSRLCPRPGFLVCHRHVPLAFPGVCGNTRVESRMQPARARRWQRRGAVEVTAEAGHADGRHWDELEARPGDRKPCLSAAGAPSAPGPRTRPPTLCRSPLACARRRLRGPCGAQRLCLGPRGQRCTQSHPPASTPPAAGTVPALPRLRTGRGPRRTQGPREPGPRLSAQSSSCHKRCRREQAAGEEGT